MTIVVVGASNGPGRLLFDALRESGVDLLGIARQQRNLQTSEAARFISLDASDTDALEDLLSPGDILVHCSRPELLTPLAARQPDIDRLIALGSTRIYTRFPDDKCARLTAMTHAIWMTDLKATILHPTMIYGAPGLNNIERVMQFARRFPYIPLPADGAALIQPVHASDVVNMITACISDRSTIGRTLIIAGGAPLTYRQFVERCITHANTRCRVISMPYWLMGLLGWATQLLPFVPAVSPEEIRRLLEDKAFAVEDASRLLGRSPLDFETGISLPIPT